MYVKASNALCVCTTQQNSKPKFSLSVDIARRFTQDHKARFYSIGLADIEKQRRPSECSKGDVRRTIKLANFVCH